MILIYFIYFKDKRGQVSFWGLRICEEDFFGGLDILKGKGLCVCMGVFFVD